MPITPHPSNQSLNKKKVAILQSNYIPWKGYFDIIRDVDEFILYDDVQFTRRDWRNRNQVKSPQGLVWLTIPVVTKSRYSQKICETEISDFSWAEQHWNVIRQHYAKAPAFSFMAPRIQKMLEEASYEKTLSRANYSLLSGICKILGINTPLTWSMDYAVQGTKTDRLIELCEAAKADCYLSGPAAKSYMEEDKFDSKHITLQYMNYDGYPEYPQLHGEFVHGVSIIDALLMLGDAAATKLFR